MTAMQCAQFSTHHPGQPVPADTEVIHTDVLAPIGVHGVDTRRCTRRAHTTCPSCRRNVCTPCSTGHGVLCTEEAAA